MIAITYFAGGHRSPQGQRRQASWLALCRWLAAPIVTAEKHDAPGFSLATYRGDRRSLSTVEQVFVCGVDLDKNVDLERLRVQTSSTRSFVHTTWSSTLEAPRARVYLSLSRPVTGDEFRRVYQYVTGIIERGGLEVDRAVCDPSRFWFRPSIRSVDAPFICWGSEGIPVDVDTALAAVPPPAPPPVPCAPAGPVGDVEARAIAYLDQVEPAISGSNGGTWTFVVAQKLVRGFGLDEGTAYRLMARWNQTCQPPWTEKDLRRKIRQAAQRGTMAEGALRDAQRPR
jgi:hypothetical protein